MKTKNIYGKYDIESLNEKDKIIKFLKDKNVYNEHMQKLLNNDDFSEYSFTYKNIKDCYNMILKDSIKVKKNNLLRSEFAKTKKIYEILFNDSKKLSNEEISALFTTLYISYVYTNVMELTDMNKLYNKIIFIYITNLDTLLKYVEYYCDEYKDNINGTKYSIIYDKIISFRKSENDSIQKYKDAIYLLLNHNTLKEMENYFSDLVEDKIIKNPEIIKSFSSNTELKKILVTNNIKDYNTNVSDNFNFEDFEKINLNENTIKTINNDTVKDIFIVIVSTQESNMIKYINSLIENKSITRKLTIVNITNNMNNVLYLYDNINTINIFNIPNIIYVVPKIDIIKDCFYTYKIDDKKDDLILTKFKIDEYDNITIKEKKNKIQVNNINKEFMYIFTELTNQDDINEVYNFFINKRTNIFNKIKYIKKYSDFHPMLSASVLSKNFYIMLKFYYMKFIINSKMSKSQFDDISKFNLDYNLYKNFFMFLFSKLILNKNVYFRDENINNIELKKDIIEYSNHRLEDIDYRFLNVSNNLNFFYIILATVSHLKKNMNDNNVEKTNIFYSIDDDIKNIPGFSVDFCIIEVYIQFKQLLFIGFISENIYYIYNQKNNIILEYDWRLLKKGDIIMSNYKIKRFELIYIKNDIFNINPNKIEIPLLSIEENNKNIYNNIDTKIYLIINSKDKDSNYFKGKSIFTNVDDVDVFLESLIKNKDEKRLIIIKNKDDLENYNSLINNFLKKTKISLPNTYILNYTNTTDILIYNTDVCKVLNALSSSNILYSFINRIDNDDKKIQKISNYSSKYIMVSFNNLFIKKNIKDTFVEEEISYIYSHIDNIEDLIYFFINNIRFIKDLNIKDGVKDSIVEYCGFGRLKQFTGTCWFNSILNGMILSEYMSIILKSYYLNETKDNIELRSEIHNSDLNVCLKKGGGNIKKYLLTFIYNILIKKNRAIATDGNIVARLAALIKTKTFNEEATENNTYNTLKNAEKASEGSNFTAYIYFYKYIFNDELNVINYFQDINDSSKNKTAICIKTFYSKNDSLLPEKIKVGDNEFILDNCLIKLSNGLSTAGHAICGFKCKGKYYIYNSNEDEIYESNWYMNSRNPIEDKYKGGFLETSITLAIYINSSKFI